MFALLIRALEVFNQILSAGISITAFSFLLYALTFNLRDRVARSFAGLLAFVTAVYFCDTVVSTVADVETAAVWLRLQWIGIAFVPVAYLHFSDALLATTGQPSRGRRRQAIRILYGTAGVFLIAATLTNVLVYGSESDSGAFHLRAGPLFVVFLVYFAGSLLWAGWNFLRAYQRCQTSTTRRRMAYLMTAAVAPALGSFPFLLISGQTAALHPLIFWTVAVTTNVTVAGLLVVLAYAVAYFGVSQPDRIVKARLFQWLLRGPVVVSTVLAVYVLVNRYGPRMPYYDPRALPFVVIGVLLVLQFLITLVRLPIERALFYGADRQELRRLQILEERLLTSGDLHQFLESVLAGACDALGAAGGFIAALGGDGKIEYHVAVGPAANLDAQWDALAATALPTGVQEAEPAGLRGAGAPARFVWGDYWVFPLRNHTSREPLGLLGLLGSSEARPFTADEANALQRLAGRAAAALEDWRLQREVFGAIDRLLPQIEQIQRLRASARYSGVKALTSADELLANPDLAQIIKDALTHYWGGPRLTDSPLLQLRVVERALREHNGNATNALRAVLREAIERIRPEGERRFTAEWILYNILEMKFLQNRRVREVALRLAVSEADLYRKQRVALEALAGAIVIMEQEAAERATDYDVAG